MGNCIKSLISVTTNKNNKKRVSCKDCDKNSSEQQVNLNRPDFMEPDFDHNTENKSLIPTERKQSSDDKLSVQMNLSTDDNSSIESVFQNNILILHEKDVGLNIDEDQIPTPNTHVNYKNSLINSISLRESTDTEEYE
jgi:hypothetical protein